MSISRQAIVACFLFLGLGIILIDAIGVGGGGEQADTRVRGSTSAAGGKPYDKVCLVNSECDLGQGVLIVKEVRYVNSSDTNPGNPGDRFVAVEFTYEYKGSLGSVDVRRLPFVLDAGGGGLHEYD